jgi:hypothetical protein
MDQSEYPSKVSSDDIQKSLYDATKLRFKDKLDAYKEDLRRFGGDKYLPDDTLDDHRKSLIPIYFHLNEFIDRKKAKQLYVEIIQEAKAEAKHYADDNMAGIHTLTDQFRQNFQYSDVSLQRAIALAGLNNAQPN